jgi:UDP-GlcNAc:undecaprenyl-phosphate GlcNAc-1-phosphate transferase
MRTPAHLIASEPVWTTAATAGVAFVAALLAAACLVRLAPRVGLLDAPDGVRKLQARAVPLVGGSAILFGLTAAALCASVLGVGALPGLERGPGSGFGAGLVGLLPAGPPLGAWLAACLLAFLVGLADDVLELTPVQKLLGQLAAAGALAAPLALAGELQAALLLCVAAVAAQNVANTFDNADGAVLVVAVPALALSAPPLAAALAACAPGNLGPARARTPRLYLGDSGTHLIGLLLLSTPAAWGALVLPTLDLALVVAARLRARQRPWVGDRRHLAHRLQARGLGRLGVAAALFSIGAPAVALCAAGPHTPGTLGLGIGATALLFALALVASRTEGACPRAGRGR